MSKAKYLNANMYRLVSLKGLKKPEKGNMTNTRNKPRYLIKKAAKIIQINAAFEF
jgi:hypothetical protein